MKLGTPQYDLEALKANISRLEGEVETFKAIVDRSVKEGRMNQAVVFTKAVEDAEEDIRELRGYISEIRSGKHGNPV